MSFSYGDIIYSADLNAVGVITSNGCIIYVTPGLDQSHYTRNRTGWESLTLPNPEHKYVRIDDFNLSTFEGQRALWERARRLLYPEELKEFGTKVIVGGVEYIYINTLWYDDEGTCYQWDELLEDGVPKIVS